MVVNLRAASMEAGLGDLPVRPRKTSFNFFPMNKLVITGGLAEWCADGSRATITKRTQFRRRKAKVDTSILTAAIQTVTPEAGL
jgi:hypothetical protein